MVQIINVFGWLGIIAAVVLAAVGIGSRSMLLTVLLPIAAYCLLSGALLVAFGRVVELLEQLNLKIEPIYFIATQLADKYKPEKRSPSQDEEAADDFDSLPAGSHFSSYRGRRVATLPDGSVLAETMTTPKRFASFEEYRDYVD
jgi:hypothetical protein